MTDNANLQRRESDQVGERKSRRNETIATIAVLLTGAWWVAGQAAKEEVLPIRDMALENRILINNVVGDITDIRVDLKEILQIMREKKK
mgnify:CR=1 FL=1|tara:strand:+ start:183 stop:449 length:267 start_codon:yes stop_codon:yes gene_type:complete